MTAAVGTGEAFTRPPVVQAPADPAWYEGAGIVEAAAACAKAIGDGDWASAAGNGASAAMGALGAAMDPFQALCSAGVGWLLEHVEVLREPLDWLAGDARAVDAHGATWRAVGERLDLAAGRLHEAVAGAVGPWRSTAVDAYVARVNDQLADLAALRISCGAHALLTHQIGLAVAVVRNTVRDVIAEVVGAIVSKALQAVGVVTAPKIILEVGLLVAETAVRISALLHRLVSTIGDLLGRAGALSGVLRALGSQAPQPALLDTAAGAALLQAGRVEATVAAQTTPNGFDAAATAYRELARTHTAVHGGHAEQVRAAAVAGLQHNYVQGASAYVDERRAESPMDGPPLALPL
ncbi:MAG TPA: hypothetical protein VFY17_06825 [Pilimelia sp.]|nr:hypothetical protein [Pilimelia sp.]